MNSKSKEIPKKFGFRLHKNAKHSKFSNKQLEATLAELNREKSVAEVARLLELNDRGTSVYVSLYRMVRLMFLKGALEVNSGRLKELEKELKKKK